MSLKITKYEGGQERTVLIGMVTDRGVLAEVAARWEPDLFQAKWSNLVGRWCVSYWGKYSKPPGRDIAGYFERWAEKNQGDEETVSLMEKFLATLSNEYDQTDRNTSYVLDVASQLFDRVRAVRLANQVLECCNGKADIDGAKELIAGFRPVGIGMGAGYDLFLDKEAIARTFDETQSDRLIDYPGAAGEFFGNIFERDALVSFVAPSKFGKTWMLLDVAYRAMLHRRRVAFFEVGDLSERQINTRFLVRAARHPRRLKNGFPGVVQWPRRIYRGEPDEDGDVGAPEVERAEKAFDRPLTAGQAYKAAQALMRSRVKSSDSYFKCSVHPSGSVTIANIESVLELWQRDGWVPDVVVIDYADLLKPLPGTKDLDRINETWLYMRGISQRWHCLLVTATQGNAASHKAVTMGRMNFSGDRRKMDHVTAMIGISGTPSERDRGIRRLNRVVVREEEEDSRQLYVATCLELANPVVVSSWLRDDD